MEEFTTQQFTEMPRPTKISSITNCINMIQNNTLVKIDETEITEIAELVSWLIRTLESK